MKLIQIPVPIVTDDLQDYFSQFVTNDSGDVGGSLVAALDLDVPDDRATVDDVSVEDVELHEDGSVTVHYTVQYSAYHGCRDMNYADDDLRAVTGVRDGGDWVFTVYVSPERLAPNEEL
jgi:hypothetical protein